MLILISIVMLITGILQFILFFKIWGMTDNVRHIKNHIAAEDYDFKTFMMMDERQKALDLIKVEIASLLEHLLIYPGHIVRRETFIKWVEDDKDLASLYRKAELTGIELPPQLRSGEVYWDFYMSLIQNKEEEKKEENDKNEGGE